MSRNATQLSIRKQKVIAQIATGSTISDAADSAKVDRCTVHRWYRDDPLFRAGLSQIRTEVSELIRDQVLSLAGKAVNAIEAALDDNDAKTAINLLKGLRILDTGNSTNVSVTNQSMSMTDDHLIEPVTDDEVEKELSQLLQDPEIREIMLSYISGVEVEVESNE